MEAVKSDYIRDVKNLKIKLDQTEIELEEVRSQSSFHRAMSVTTISSIFDSRADNCHNNMQGSHSRIEDSEAELSFSKKMISKHQQEIERLTQVNRGS